MKVLFVCEGFNRVSVVAQPWRHIYEIAKRLKPLGHDVKILTDLVDNLPRDELLDGISIHRIEKGFYFFNIGKLIKALNKEAPDIINWFGGPLSSLYFSRIENSIKQKIVWNMYKGKLSFSDLRNLDFVEQLSLLKDVQFIYSLFPSFFIRRGSMSPRVSLIIVWSKRLKEYLQDIGVDSDKITIVSSGVDVESFRTPDNLEIHDFEMRFAHTPRDQVVLYFGSLSSFRGLDVLVSAMKKVMEKNSNVRLLILARDKEPSKVYQFLKHAVYREKIWIVSGIQSQSKVVKFLSMANLVVLPFKSWPHQEVPLTILEAMSMGKVVISTSIYPVIEIVENGKTGILIPPNNVDLLSQKIIEVLSNQEKFAPIGKTASIWVEGCHSWSLISEKTLRIFENVIKPFSESADGRI